MSNHLRICIIAYRFAPMIGGAEKRAEKLARQLVACGHEVTVLTLRTDRALLSREWMDGIQVIRIGGIYRHGGTLHLGKFGCIPSTASLLLMLLRLRGSYDIIHVCQFGTFAAAATLAAQLVHVPVVISSQSAGPSREQSQRIRQKPMLLADTLEETDELRIAFHAWAFAGSDVSSLPSIAFGGGLMLRFLRHSRAYYQVLSRRCRELLIEQGFSPERMISISGSVDTNRFIPLPTGRPSSEVDARSIICVARLEYSKGIDVLLHAWKRMLVMLGPRVSQLKPRLSIVGGGELRAQLLWIATELGIRSSVEFLGARDDVLSLLQHSWGFVFPSRWEGMPNALLEAMACGLPCIATQVSGSEEIITSEVDGLLVRVEDPVALADALCRLVCDDLLAQRLGEQARITVVQKYQLSHVVAQCLELYQHLLQPSCGVLQHAVESRGGE